MPKKPEICGCTIRDDNIVDKCDWHNKYQSKLVKVTATIILRRVIKILDKTHLKELQEEIQEEIERFVK